MRSSRQLGRYSTWNRKKTTLFSGHYLPKSGRFLLGHLYTYIHIHTHSSEHRDAGRAKEITNGAAVNAACDGNISKCLFGHACRRFASPALNGLAGRLPKTRFEPATFQTRKSNANRYIATPSHKAAQNTICRGAWK